MKFMKGITSLTAWFCSVALIINPAKSFKSDTYRLSTCSHLSGMKSSFNQEKSKYQYVGAEKCASVCHNNDKTGFQYNMWKSGPHSKAFNTLYSDKSLRYAKKAGIEGKPEESAACLKCHVTGSGLDSSFLTATWIKEDGVTCESCHKQKYVPKTFRPKETDCIECHNSSAHKMPGFNFRKELLKIGHPMPEKL